MKKNILTPIKFAEANRLFSGKDCIPLHAYADEENCCSCWKLSFPQRLSALFTGRIWLNVLSGGGQPPVWLAVGKTIFKEAPKNATPPVSKTTD